MLKAETAPANFTTTIYQYLWHEISTLKLLPGTKLSEAKLARKFNCSRVPVREAVHLLVKEGALEARPKIGSFVTYIDLEHLERIRYLREALECKIILEGCKKNLFDPIIPYLDDLIARQRAYINASAFELAFQLDTEFHRIFYNLTHKEFVLSHTGKAISITCAPDWWRFATMIPPHSLSSTRPSWMPWSPMMRRGCRRRFFCI